MLLGCLIAPSAVARVDFKGVFAPSETWVKAPEKTFRDDICLNGSWQFQPVALPSDFHQGSGHTPDLPLPTADGWDKTPLRIPSPWNVNAFADEHGLGGDFRTYPSYPKAWEQVKMGWLRRSFDVPASWKGRRILLHLAAAAGDLRFMVNGKDVGTRFDIFFPFDIDVTDSVQYGATNELLVGVRKPELLDVPGKFGRRTYQAGSFWGQHVVGIWQDIDLVAVPNVRVSNVFVQPLVDQDALKAEVTLHNDSAVDATVEVSGHAQPWISQAAKGEGWDPTWKLDNTTSLGLPASTVTVPAHGEQKVTLQQKVAGALQPWSPDSPSLYGLLIDLKSGGQPVDRKYTRFGWRQFTFQGLDMLLNGKPITLKGDSWHFLGIPQMTRRYPWAWFTALHDAHLNAVRLHAEPYPEFYLDVADEMGIMVLDETAIWASDGGPKLDDDTFWQDTKSHVGQLVTRDRSHPAVFGWSVCNEVSPVVRFVFHNPPGMFDKLLSYYPIWAGTVRDLDPTRPWISADGDDDGGGTLPTFMIHYGDASSMAHAVKVGKPWGVGEASGAYFATPEQAAKGFGERAYESFQGRMEAISYEAYHHLRQQRNHNGNYESVFNLVWYGLHPLPLGLADTTKAPTLDDGIFFPHLVEGQPGVQPERLGPYCTTLNPGYDPSLPLYQPWPLFEAIKDAESDPPVDLPYQSSPEKSDAGQASAPTPVNSIAVAAGPGSGLKGHLAALGVPFPETKISGIPDLLFIDGAHPPDAATTTIQMQAVLAAGHDVFIWGASPDTLAQLNALLPASLEITDRKSSSLLLGNPDPITAGLKPSAMYFSELSPALILNGGLGGPLADKSIVLLKACDTDWLLWNGKPEYAKIGMIVRSENEAKSSGAALIELKQGNGRLFVCNLPADSDLPKAQALARTLLANLGIGLGAVTVSGDAVSKSGELTRALGVGRFPAPDSDPDKAFVDPTLGDTFRVDTEVVGKKWAVLTADNDSFHLRGEGALSGSDTNSVTYLSFWVLSPRSLDDLLIEPNTPKLDLDLKASDACEIWLNGKSVLKTSDGGTASGLPLQRGWNHFLIRALHRTGDPSVRAKLICNQPAFLDELKSALQKP